MKIQRICPVCKTPFIAGKINHFYCKRNCYKKAYYKRSKTYVMPVIKKLRKQAEDDFFTPKEISLALNQNSCLMVRNYIKSGMLKIVDEKTAMEINKTNKKTLSQKTYIRGRDFNEFLINYVEGISEKTLLKSEQVISRNRWLFSVTKEDIKNEKYYQEMLKVRESRFLSMRKYRTYGKNNIQISKENGTIKKEKKINNSDNKKTSLWELLLHKGKHRGKGDKSK